MLSKSIGSGGIGTKGDYILVWGTRIINGVNWAGLQASGGRHYG